MNSPRKRGARCSGPRPSRCVHRGGPFCEQTQEDASVQERATPRPSRRPRRLRRRSTPMFWMPSKAALHRTVKPGPSPQSLGDAGGGTGMTPPPQRWGSEPTAAPKCRSWLGESRGALDHPRGPRPTPNGPGPSVPAPNPPADNTTTRVAVTVFPLRVPCTTTRDPVTTTLDEALVAPL
jgi:hypothetical protein